MTTTDSGTPPNLISQTLEMKKENVSLNIP